LIDLLVSGSVLLLLDQWSKETVRLFAPDRAVYYAHFVRIRRVNHGSPIYRSQNARMALVIVWVFAAASAIVLRDSGSWFQGRVSVIGLGLVLGGAAGNLLDIWRHQSVVDFIDFGWWPAFNFADVGIVAGLLLAFWH
jgi:lipoprotein signal peptidase